MGDLNPGRTGAGQDVANEEFRVGGVELAASDMNHHGKMLCRGGCNHFGDFAALDTAADVNRRGGEMEL